jgi:hypothetical protein
VNLYHSIALSTDRRPTLAQREAGNYRKSRVDFQGLQIAIECPAGSYRAGKGWRVKMHNHYGYIVGTNGRDGDPLDVFLGDQFHSQKVYIINQIDQNGKFDEHKIMLGFSSRKEARTAYLSNYTRGWRVGPVAQITVDRLKEWIKEGNASEMLLKALHSACPLVEGDCTIILTFGKKERIE